MAPFNTIWKYWHLTKMAHDKYSTWNRQTWHPQKCYLKRMAQLAKKCQGLSWMISKRKFLNLLYDSDSWSWDFKFKFFPLQSDIPITLLCLIVAVGSISRVLVVLQKANNVVVRYQFCEIPFTLGAIFARWYFW